jgi:hypothetical protein
VKKSRGRLGGRLDGVGRDEGDQEKEDVKNKGKGERKITKRRCRRKKIIMNEVMGSEKESGTIRRKARQSREKTEKRKSEK